MILGDYFLSGSLLKKISGNIHYLFICVGILIIYLLIRSLIIWLININAIRLLSYLASSLFVLLLLLLMVIFLDQVNHLFLKAILQCLSFFGVAVFIIYIFTYVKNTYKKA